MYCTNCGAQLNSTDVYCSQCGVVTGDAPRRQQPQVEKRLMRSRTDSKIAGVCGGVAEYLGVDSTLVRLIWLFAAVFPPLPGFFAYLVAWIVMPKEPWPAAASEPAGTRAW
ncbi:MAG TPA: PspC domain-containing protein [Bryobacteraceae bacterium]|nr:PspC domain-containing protein [Bryobacteraceae bacterium]